MSFETETSELAEDMKEAFGRTITVTTQAILSETFSPTSGVRTNSDSEQFTITAWSSRISRVDEKVDERVYYFAAADLDTSTYGIPSAGWKISDPDTATRPTDSAWQVAFQPELEADNAIWRLTCRRAP